MEDGVVCIYQDEQAKELRDAKDYPFYKLPTFIKDMNLICAMIANGPL